MTAAVLTAPARTVAVLWETSQFASNGDAAVATERVSARAAYQFVLHGRAILVDIRVDAQRRAEGDVHPGLRPVVLELDWVEGWLPAGARVLVLCGDGYASELAAASLARRGVDATAVVGGMQAWREDGLPTAVAH